MHGHLNPLPEKQLACICIAVISRFVWYGF